MERQSEHIGCVYTFFISVPLLFLLKSRNLDAPAHPVAAGTDTKQPFPHELDHIFICFFSVIGTVKFFIKRGRVIYLSS